MKLPRDLDSNRLIRALEKLGYTRIRQAGSHLRIEHPGPPKHRITIPVTKGLKIGTLNAILTDVASHLKIDRAEIIKKL